MELSRKVVNAHFWQVAALTLCIAGVGLSGLLLFGVGIFLTLPLAVAACVYAYEDIFGGIDPRALAIAAPAPIPNPGPSNPSTDVPPKSPSAESAQPPSATGLPPTLNPTTEPVNPMPEDKPAQS
jgi:hypothetical protein